MSSIEPSLQPSFKFPSRHTNANYAKGLLDQSAASQLLLIRPSSNTNISLETPMQSTLTVPKTLDKDVIDVKPVFPVDTAIYVQPGLAEGLTALAKQTNADVEITKLTSGNNALKRGNYVAAESIVGRQLTQEEIANRTQTPNTRVSEMNPQQQTHVNFSNYSGLAFGSQLAPGRMNHLEKQNMLKKMDADLINRLAQRYGLPVNIVSQVKTSMGFTGDTVLGAKGEISEADMQRMSNQFLHHFTNVYGVTPDEFKNRGNAEYGSRQQPISNVHGENRPTHTGTKARTEEAKDRRRRAQEFGRSPNEEGYAEDVTMEEEHEVKGPYGSPYEADIEMTGAPQTVNQQLNDVRVGGAPDHNNGRPILGPQGEYRAQENVSAGVFQDKPSRILVPPTLPNDQPANMSDAHYAREGGLNAQLLKDLEHAEFKHQYARMDVEENEIQEPVLVDDEEMIPGNMIEVLQAKKEEFINRLKEATKEYYKYGGDKLDIANVLPNDVNKQSISNLFTVDQMKKINQHNYRIEIRDLKNLLKDVNRAILMEGKKAKKTQKPKSKGKGITGGAIGGVRPRRSLKHQHFNMPDYEFTPKVDAFSSRGAIASGRLMENTGHNAVPISAQIQVANTKQLFETPLQDWVRHPNYTSELKPRPIPIAQNFIGVGQRAKKVALGGYLVDHHKLLSQNVLSLSHPTGRKVKGMPNREVSNNMKESIHKIISGGKVNTSKLTTEEKMHLRSILHKSAANVSIGADVNVSPTQQLHLILGEIEAGNDSPDLKSQLKKLLPALKRGKCISAEQCTDISNHYL